MIQIFFFLCVLLIPSPDGRGVQVSHAAVPIPNAVCQNIWNSAGNNLIVGPGKDLEVDPSNIEKLLTVTPSGRKKLAKAVFTAFQNLVDSYDPGSLVRNAEKLRRQDRFLNTLLVPGSPVDVAYQYLKSIGKTRAKTLAAFKAVLRTAWFDTYKKKKTGSFSGFEHTFVGELRTVKQTSSKQKITLGGFHNWYQFYIKKDDCLTVLSVNDYKKSYNPPLLEIGFTWHGAVKKRSGFFVGPSPAFEMALFSACFLGVMGTGLPTSQQCTCTINGDPVMIQAVANPTNNIITTYPG